MSGMTASDGAFSSAQGRLMPQGAVGNWIGALAGPIGTLAGGPIGGIAGGLLGHQLASLLPFQAAPQLAPQGAVANILGQLAGPAGGWVGNQFGQGQIGSQIGNTLGQLASLLPFQAAPQLAGPGAQAYVH
jgi:hypothetical protein